MYANDTFRWNIFKWVSILTNLHRSCLIMGTRLSKPTASIFRSYSTKKYGLHKMFELKLWKDFDSDSKFFLHNLIFANFIDDDVTSKYWFFFFVLRDEYLIWWIFDYVLLRRRRRHHRRVHTNMQWTKYILLIHVFFYSLPHLSGYIAYWTPFHDLLYCKANEMSSAQLDFVNCFLCESALLH